MRVGGSAGGSRQATAGSTSRLRFALGTDEMELGAISGCARISVIACSCAALRLWGGKSRVGAGAAPSGPQAAGE